MTGFPPVGPASAYPILSRPASICLSEENEVVLGLAVASTAGEFAPASPNSGCCAKSVVPTETAAMARRRRRETPFGSVCCIYSCLLLRYVGSSGFHRPSRTLAHLAGQQTLLRTMPTLDRSRN